jgi:hypothetical protein
MELYEPAALLLRKELPGYPYGLLSLNTVYNILFKTRLMFHAQKLHKVTRLLVTAVVKYLNG